MVKLLHLQEAAAKLGHIDEGTVGSYLEELPKEWEVSVAAKRALARLILERAAYLADDNRVVQAVCRACGLLPLRWEG